MPTLGLSPLLMFVLAWPASGGAEIFRCVEENGVLTFSQTPCANSKVTVRISSKRGGDDDIDCDHAHRFALSTAREMKAGADSPMLFDRYGGLSALSSGTVSLISYVYQFRTNNDVSAARIAALSAARCRARSFGDVSCEVLPASFTSRLGGCKRSGDNSGGASVPIVEKTPAQALVVQQESRLSQQAANRAARAVKQQQREECRDEIRSQLDAINSKMRSGYTGSQEKSLRNRRRDLEGRLRQC